jgi:antagonist of KipI
MRMLRVLRPGALTTVQDLGRPGLGRTGVSPSGAMDPLALCVANRLIGNLPGAAALEVTGPGAQLQFEETTVLGLAGADLDARVAGRPLPEGQAHRIEAGAVLSFEGRLRGARAYLALPGGLRVPEVMGSAATDLDARLGGLAGTPLRRGDRLEWHGSVDADRRGSTAPAWSTELRLWYHDPFELAVVATEEAAPAALRVLIGSAYRVGSRSSRMGYRLEGAPVPVPVAAAEAISEAIAPGAIQVTADGQPILLMADRQTVGGYPVLAHLARAHLPRAAQLWPGDQVSFVPVSVEEAQQMARRQAAWLARL